MMARRKTWRENYVMHSSKSEKHSWRIVLIVILAGAAIVLWYLNSDSYRRGRYPLEYIKIIQENADRYHLDPYRVAAVIRTESGFDPEAVSGAGAVGLMQIMPDTGEWIAGKLEITDFEPDLLFDPEHNIEMGCWYLQFLQERFHDDPELVAAAYNAGHGRVSEWLSDDSVSHDGEHLQDIPYRETREYVERIGSAYEAYRRLYPDAFS